MRVSSSINLNAWLESLAREITNRVDELMMGALMDVHTLHACDIRAYAYISLWMHNVSEFRICFFSVIVITLWKDTSPHR